MTVDRRTGAARGIVRRALTAALLSVALVLAGLEVVSRLGLIPCYTKLAGVWEVHPAFGWFHRPGVQGWGQGCLGRDAEWHATVEINQHGLRDVEHEYAKGDGVFRILILGDSFIEGFNVDFEDHFLKRLQERLGALSPKIEVMAAAVSAWGTDQELLYFLLEGVKYNPDLVVLAFNPGNDIAENNPGLGLPKPREAKKPSFTLDDGRLTLHDYPIRTPAPDDRWIVKLDDTLARRTYAYPVLRHLADKLRTTIAPPAPRKRRAAQTQAGHAQAASHTTPPAASPGSAAATTAASVARPPDAAPTPKPRPEVSVDAVIALDPLPPRWEAGWQLSKALVRDLRKRVESSGAAFAATIVPSKFAVGGPRIRYSPSWERDDLDPTVPERRTEEFLAAERIPTCTLLPRFRAHLEATGRNGFFAFDIHWNEDGHRIVADALADCLAPMIPERVLPRS
ncbi:MAG: SGNH/GDSL hydrolase family protein [bacterium]